MYGGVVDTTIALQVIEIASELLEQRGIATKPDRQKKLSENGLDSIGRLTLLTRLEKTLEISFPESCWGQGMFLNLNEIIQYITDHRSEK